MADKPKGRLWPAPELTPVPREQMLTEVRADRPDETILDDIDPVLLFAMWLRS